jgi:hypothetical protein
MAMALIKELNGLHEIDPNTYEVILLYVATDGTLEVGPAIVTIQLSVGATAAQLRDAVCDAVEVDAFNNYGITLGTFGSPVPLGRRILFPNGVWGNVS